MKLKFKQTLMALFALAIILTAGFNQEAKAFSVVNGDLYLALYGNGTEKYYDLGTVASVLNGTAVAPTITAADLTLVSGANAVKWAIAGYDTTTSLLYNSIKTFPLTAAQLAQVSLLNGFNTFAGTFGLNTDNSAATTSMSLLATNTQSYSQTQDPTGNGSFNSTYPVTTSGIIGSTFALISGDYNTGVLSALTNTAGKSLFASLINNGNGLTLSIGAAVAAVPLPASVVMFGTGLIALAGIARRKMFVI